MPEPGVPYGYPSDPPPQVEPPYGPLRGGAP